MEKLRLELDELTVESFATDLGSEEAGTVHGREVPSIPPWCLKTRPTDCPCTPFAGA